MRMNRMKPSSPVLLAAAVSGLVGCGDATPLGLTSSALESQHARWLAAGLQDYRFEYLERCECSLALVEPAVVEVRGGRVREVTYRSSGLAAPSDARALFPTIEDLFARIEDAIAREAAMLVVSYDPELGYPTQIEIDYDLQVVDDEVSIDATGLVAL